MKCSLCPRQCSAVRDAVRGAGFCRMPAAPVVARAALHQWEEPPISGVRGSGTVFFSGCSLRCVFCQNEVISHRNFGSAITVDTLRDIFLRLIGQGAHNINLVNPTHYAHAVAAALERPLPVPVVWNSGGYDRVETLRMLEGKVQIYLPDYKYRNPTPAGDYSAAPDYPAVAEQAILEMYRQTGSCLMEDGLLRRGTVIRHLILPGLVGEAKAVMDWVSAAFPKGEVLFSLMSQYIPWGRALEIAPLNRRLRGSELRTATAYMENLNLQGFTQAPESATGDYIPMFDLTGVN